MKKKKNKLFVFDIPATMQYKIFAKNKTAAKKMLIENAGFSITGEPLFLEDDFRKAEPITSP